MSRLGLSLTLLLYDLFLYNWQFAFVLDKNDDHLSEGVLILGVEWMCT